MSYSDEPISIVEDLDPEPPPKRGGRQNWEVIAGALLLLAVLGFAGWQWVQQESRQSSYAAGLQAAARQDWDGALAFFGKAAGYRDAGRYEEEAKNKVGERNRQYKVATDYKAEGNWPACLNAIQKVTAIAPGYKDASEIEKQARRQTFSDAMSGTVALRPSATPPGLYYYSLTGWLWLPQSDGVSRIRGNGSNDRVIYDVPDANTPFNSTPPRPGRGSASNDLTGRALMSVQLSGLSEAKLLSIQPGDHTAYIPFRDGVWAAYYGAGLYRPSPVRFSYYGMTAVSLTYQSYTSTVTATTTFPGMKNPVLLAVDTSSNSYLVADWSDADPESRVVSSTVSTLYLGRAGVEPRMIYQVKGSGFNSAQISSDGRFALVNSYTPVGHTSLGHSIERQTILLLDLQRAAPPRKLTELTHEQDAGFLGFLYWLTATFIPDGPFKGKIMLAQKEGGNYHLQVLDPEVLGASPADGSLVDVVVPTTGTVGWTVGQGSDDLMLISGQENPNTTAPDQLPSLPLHFITIAGDKTAKVTRLTVGQGSFVDNAVLVGDRLVYSTIEYGSTGSRTTRSVFSFPIRRFGIEGERPWTMYKQTGSADGNDISNYGSQTFGPNLFTYISENELHARTYDGSVDVMLEPRVTYLYSLVMFARALLR